MKKLNKLTKEQKDKMPEYVAKWSNIGNSTVSKDFYTDKVIDTIKKCTEKMYLYADEKILKENILISPSPIMSPFIASAHVVGKKGKPRKTVKCKLDNMGKVEDFLNGFKNPKEIIKNASKYPSLRYWLSLDAGFLAFVDFFYRETDIDLKQFEDIILNMQEISHIAYDILIADNFCVVSKKPIEQALKMKDGYLCQTKGDIVWEDDTIIKVL